MFSVMTGSAGLRSPCSASGRKGGRGGGRAGGCWGAGPLCAGGATQSHPPQFIFDDSLATRPALGESDKFVFGHVRWDRGKKKG